MIGPKEEQLETPGLKYDEKLDKRAPEKIEENCTCSACILLKYGFLDPETGNMVDIPAWREIIRVAEAMVDSTVSAAIVPIATSASADVVLSAMQGLPPAIRNETAHTLNAVGKLLQASETLQHLGVSFEMLEETVSSANEGFEEALNNLLKGTPGKEAEGHDRNG